MICLSFLLLKAWYKVDDYRFLLSLAFALEWICVFKWSISLIMKTWSTETFVIYLFIFYFYFVQIQTIMEVTITRMITDQATTTAVVVTQTTVLLLEIQALVMVAMEVQALDASKMVSYIYCEKWRKCRNWWGKNKKI